MGKGSGWLGALGAGLLPAFGIQPCSLGLAGEAMGPGLRDFAVKHAPPLQVSSVWENGTFLEGWDLAPGDCTFISDSRLSETDGLLGAWFCVCVCVRAADVQIDDCAPAHKQAGVPRQAVGEAWLPSPHLG